MTELYVAFRYTAQSLWAQLTARIRRTVHAAPVVPPSPVS
jgi:hypothetical protein